MPLSLTESLTVLPVLALVFFRLGGLVLTAPIFGSTQIPMQIRAALLLTVTVVVFPLIRPQAPAALSLQAAIVGAVGEMMIGATIGMAFSLMLLGAEAAGVVVGQQAGVALANVFDPTQDRQVTVIGQVYTIVLTILFLLVGGHRAAMAAVLDTFRVIPLLSFRVEESIIVLLVEMLAAAFVLGIRLAAPVLLALFLMGTALGFLSRTMPQLNILTVGFTLRVLVGLAVAALAIRACEPLLLDVIWNSVEQVRLAFGLDPLNTRLVG